MCFCFLACPFLQALPLSLFLHAGGVPLPPCLRRLACMHSRVWCIASWSSVWCLFDCGMQAWDRQSSCFFEISVACRAHILAPCACVPAGVFLGAAGGKVQDYALPCNEGTCKHLIGHSMAAQPAAAAVLVLRLMGGMNDICQHWHT